MSNRLTTIQTQKYVKIRLYRIISNRYWIDLIHVTDASSVFKLVQCPYRIEFVTLFKESRHYWIGIRGT